MLRISAYAKINWTLGITGRRDDGYHIMDMLLSSVSLCDTLFIEDADKIEMAMEGASPAPADERNLAMRAARALAEASGCGRGASLVLRKRIPVGAGMGGGSADAAAALIGLNRLWRLKMPMERLRDIALSLGADVPFMLRGGLMRVGGIGESLRSVGASRRWWLVAVQPCRGLSTGEVFSAYDAAPPSLVTRPDNDFAERALINGDISLLARGMGNALEAVSIAKRPRIASAIADLEAAGAARAMMTGSGSAAYGVFAGEREAGAACSRLRAKYKRVYKMHTRETGVDVEEI